MASITKHAFLFMLVGLASIASAAEREASAICNQAQPERFAQVGSQSAIRNPQSAMSLQVPFIQNQGQIADSQVLFYARTFGGTVYVTAEGEIIYALPGSDDRRQTTDDGRQTPDDGRRILNKQTSNIEHRTSNIECKNGRQTTDDSLQSEIGNRKSKILLIRETLVDADLAALPSGAERSGAIINWFIGNDPRRWQANIPSFTGVQFGDIYEGISLEVRATGDNVEKIFTVAPGADPARIALRLAGAEGVSITPAGELEARTALGPVRFTAPVAYQMGAAGERQGVSVAYALEGDQVGFCVGAFDAARPLVIDPLLASTFIGGTNGNNVVRAMAMDSQTNMIVAGYTASAYFPATNTPYQGGYGGGLGDAFIAKFDPYLTNLLAATYLGGAGDDAIMAMAINTNNGAVYVAGYTASANFPMKNAIYANYCGGAYDAFVAVLDGNLTNLAYSTFLGGTNVDMAYALALSAGPAQDVFVAGLTASTNFPIANTFGANSFQTNLSRAAGATVTNDAFVVRFNPDLSTNRASTYLGGTNDDGAYGLALDTNNFVYVAGRTTSSNFPVLNGYSNRLGGACDAFVARLSTALTNRDAATFLGSTNNEAAYGIAVAPFTNIVCVVGYTESANYPRSPMGTLTIAPGYTNRFMGGKDAFLTRLDLALSNLLFSTYLGGTGDDEACAVLASATTNAPLRVYVVGHTVSPNFPVTVNAYDTTANGGRDAFVSYFGVSNALNASTYLGGNTNDSAYAMALQSDRFALFVAGATASSNFPATLRAYDNDRTGRTNDDGFVTKLGSGLAYGTKKWQVNPGSGEDWCCSPSLGWNGIIYVGVGSNLYAYDANGIERWRFRANGRINDSSLGLGSTPAVARDGTIYFGTQNGYLHAVRDNGTNGAALWTTNLFPGPPGKIIYSSPAIGNDGTIYVGQGEGAPAPFVAVGSNGIVKWTTNLPSTIFGSPAIDASGRIYVASSAPIPANSRLYMIDTNGTVQTNWSTPGDIYSSPMIGSNGWVYIGGSTKLYGFDIAGTTTQTWTTVGTVYSSPVMDTNGLIYISGGSNLYAFSTNAGTVHTWTAGGDIMSSPVIAEDGTIYVAAVGNLYAFNQDGTTNWISVPTDADVLFQSPLLRRDGTIYFTDSLNLYAMCGQSPILQAPWPAYKHDLLRTGNAAFDPAAILTPTGLAVSATGAYLNVRWQGDPNADYYEVFRGTNDPGTNLLIKTGLLTTNCLDTNVAPGVIYYYYVRVATPVALSDFSASCLGGIPPLPPTGVYASKGESPYTNEIHITWNTSLYATAYSVYRNLPGGATNWLADTVDTQYTNALPSITRGLTYYYWVQAGNGAAGTSGFSADYGVTNSGGTPPLAPTDITASTNSYLAVNVAWSTTTGATMYAVYHNTTTNIPAAFIAVTNGTNYGDAATSPFLNYYYWIRATNQYGLGEYSTSPVGYRLMGPPLSIAASDGTFTNKILVSWSDPYSVATAYRIYRNTTSNSIAESDFLAEIAYPDPTATNYYDLNITRGAGYYYWMKAKNNEGTSVMSTAYDLGGTVPKAPLNISASAGTEASRVTVTWDAADYATAYEVYCNTNYYGTPSLLGVTYGASYADASAGTGQRYYYWVKSTNQFGCSELSGFSIGWRPLASPAGLTASDGVSTGYVIVTWSSSDATSPYELWRGTSPDFSAALVLVNAVSGTTYYDIDATPGVRFYYWVRARTTQFVSAFSDYDSGWRALGNVDIGVSDLVFLPTRMAVGGAPAAVSFRVTNYGVQNIAVPHADVACKFYISSNSVYRDPDDKMGETTLSVPLAVGNSSVVVLPKAERDSIAVPAVLPGRYYISVDIQHAASSMWRDPNLANNTTNRNGGVIKVGATQPAGLQLVNDFNGDGYTDEAMYQESTGTWQVWFFGSQGFTVAGYGGVGFKAVPSDYDGDGKTDLAVYQESTGTWEIWFSAYNYAMAQIGGCGGAGFSPVPRDYDGDGLADPAVYKETTGAWRIWLSGADYAEVSVQGAGGASFQPVPGDYDGDGLADPAVYQEATGAWRIWCSNWDYAMATAAGWGGAGYRPVAADYDCDGIIDPAVFQASTGTWRIWLSASGYAQLSAQGLGNAGTVAVPGDFDGDGMADPAVYWDAFGMWRQWLSGANYQQTDLLAWPGEGFRPVWP